MPTQTIATPPMTDVARALYRITGDLLDAAVREATANPGPDTRHAMEVAALVYELIGSEYEAV